MCYGKGSFAGPSVEGPVRGIRGWCFFHVNRADLFDASDLSPARPVLIENRLAHPPHVSCSVSTGIALERKVQGVMAEETHRGMAVGGT